MNLQRQKVSRPRIALMTALLLVLTATLAPAASATEPCVYVDASVCIYHSPYSGSLYCREAWSSGAGGDALTVSVPGVGSVVLSAHYYCFNWSNYGENYWQESSIYTGVTAAGQGIYFGWTGYHDTTYNDTGGPFYNDGFYIWYDLGTGFQILLHCGPRQICPAPGPWATLFAPLFGRAVWADADCTPQATATVYVCARGNPQGEVAASACYEDPYRQRYTVVEVFGNEYRSRDAGAVGCYVFEELLD